MIEYSIGALKTSEFVKIYKEVEVPEGFTGTEEEVEEVMSENSTEEEKQVVKLLHPHCC